MFLYTGVFYIIRFMPQAFVLMNAELGSEDSIVNELKKYSRFDLTSYINTAITSINQQLNKEWAHGIQSNGRMDEIKILDLYPLREHLIVRSNCSGSLSVKVDAASFSF